MNLQNEQRRIEKLKEISQMLENNEKRINTFKDNIQCFSKNGLIGNLKWSQKNLEIAKAVKCRLEKWYLRTLHRVNVPV